MSDEKQEEKKYVFTGDTIEWRRRLLKRIRRVVDDELGG